MSKRFLSTCAAPLLVIACGGGPPSPPILGYGIPTIADVTYDYTDTTTIGVSIMGQSMELKQEGSAVYAVHFEPVRRGVAVTLTIPQLSARITAPLTAPIFVDETQVEGQLDFSLNTMGDAVLTARPTVADEASQMVSGLDLAHSFFPALPARAVATGDRWVDTVAYEGEDGPGIRSETTILTYTVIGDTMVADRSLLMILFQGTGSLSTDMTIGGMSVTQRSNLDISGHFIWDAHNGLLVESERKGVGTGTVNIPISPVPLPIEIGSTRKAKLRGT